MKHAIVYDDNKSILVVIMPVYAIEAAILVAAVVVKMVLYSTLIFNAVDPNKYRL